MMGIKRTALTALSLIFLLCAATPVFADQVLDQAKKLLDEHKPREAYQLLLPLQSQRAGEVEYDYLLGIAALDAGDAQQAVFALERVLAVNPNQLQARAEIARAYFVLGEKENARREFKTVSESRELPETARGTIDKYLTQLTPQQTFLSAYLEAAVGYDSNVNSATNNNVIAIPALGGALGQINPLGTQLPAGFAGVGAGASLSHALNQEWWLLGNAAYAGKFNFEHTQFNTGTIDLSAGVRWNRGSNALVALAQGQSFQVDNSQYRRSLGGTAQWIHNLSARQQVTVYGQYATLRYPDQQVRNADRAIGGAAYSQAFEGPYLPVAFVSGYAGNERDIKDGFSYLGFKPAGVRLGGQLTLHPTVVGFGSFGYEYREYNGVEPLFLTTRHDNQYDVSVGLNYVFAPKWTLRPQVAYTRVISNIELNSYDRTVASVALRRDF
jgi:tetratricopeptide (TPR) repeat protein